MGCGRCAISRTWANARSAENSVGGAEAGMGAGGSSTRLTSSAQCTSRAATVPAARRGVVVCIPRILHVREVGATGLAALLSFRAQRGIAIVPTEGSLYQEDGDSSL